MQRKPRVSSVDIKKFVGICLLFLIFVASTMAIVRAQTYSFSAQWGSQGSADGQFNSPFDIAVGKSGNIYVADSGNNRIQKFDSNGNFLSTWGTTGSGNGQFNGARDVAVDKSGNVYVTDMFNNRVQKFDPDGKFLTAWAEGPNTYSNTLVFYIAVDQSGSVYLSDFYNRIVKFDSNGNFLTTWGTNGTGNGQFNGPAGVCVDGSGNVFVADSGNNRIQKFDSNGNFLSTWSKGHYEGVAVDESGNVYVCGILGFIQKFSLSYSPSASSSSSPVLTPTSSPKVPEYSTITLLLLFTTATMLLVEVSKRRKWTKT